MKRGDRVSWVYQGKRTYGVVTSIAGERAMIKGPTGGNVVRVGSKDESTGNPVLKRESQLRKAPKRK